MGTDDVTPTLFVVEVAGQKMPVSLQMRQGNWYTPCETTALVAALTDTVSIWCNS